MKMRTFVRGYSAKGFALATALFVVVVVPSTSFAAEPSSSTTEPTTATPSASPSAAASSSGPAGPARSTTEASKPAVKDEDVSRGLKGFEIMLRPAFGSGGGDSPVRFEQGPGTQLRGNLGSLMNGEAPWGAGFVGQAFIGYRFIPFLSAGLRGGFRTSSASSVTDGSTNLGRSSWDAGFYLRGYPLAAVPSVSKYIDPWIGTGATYMRDIQTFKRNVPTSAGGTVLADGELDHHAVAIPIGVGVDYRALPFLSVGPSFEYTIATGVAGCAKTSAPGFAPTSYCSNEAPGSDFVKANTYGVWTLGLDVKATF